MAYSAPCPSCGAPLSFRSSVSLLAVCEFCRSTLVRHDKNIEDIGKMADLLPDQSILQIGAEGVYEGVHFAVIGRIQLRYEAGIWNEWHVLFDNMRSGWLSEAGGVSWMTFPQSLRTPFAVARVSDLVAGQTLQLDAHQFTITNIDQAECVAGQGELPFKVGAGYALTSIDLRDGNTVATLDCSHDPALFFIGKQVSLDSLKLSNTCELADQVVALPARSLKSFACPRCAAPLAQYSNKTRTIACGSCGALVDADNPTKRLVEQVSMAKRHEPGIPLGSAGVLKSQSWTVIGFMVRQSSIAYPWTEYLLMNPLGEFAWLVESSGHWSFGRAIDGVPKKGVTTRYWLGEQFGHFESFKASVRYVLGEFYWKVKLNDEVACNDYIAPPRMLSNEGSQKEQNWTLLEYMEPDEVAEAFQPASALPEPTGVGAIQPNPHAATFSAVLRNYLIFAIAAMVIQFLLATLLPHGQLVQQALFFEPGVNEEKLIARFHVDAPIKNAVVKGNSDLNNSWVELGFSLTNEKTGAEMTAYQELSYYSGWDSDGSWSEGQRNFKSFIGELPPGDYAVSIDANVEPSRYVSANISIEHGELSILNFILVELFLLLLPLLVWWRRHSFEVARWAGSDHPITWEADDE